MALQSSRRPRKSFLQTVREFVVGPSDPCRGLGEFQNLIIALKSPQEWQRSRAIQCLYERHFEVVRQEAQHWRPNGQQDAVDALSEVLGTISQRLATGTLTLDNEAQMGGYLRGAVRKKLVSYYQNDKKNPAVDAADIGQLFMITDIGSQSETERQITNQAVALAVQQLSADCRVKLFMWQHDYTHQEIGKVQEISEKSAKNGVFRCIKQLRELLLTDEAYQRIRDGLATRNNWPNNDSDEEAIQS